MKFIYHKKLIEHKEFDFRLTPKTISYPGIISLLEETELKAGAYIYGEGPDLLKLSVKMVYYTILKLSADGFLTISGLEYDHTIFSGLFSYTRTKLLIRALKDQKHSDTIDDVLARDVFTCLTFLENRDQERVDLKKLLRFVINAYLGKNTELANPRETFIFKTIEKYKNFDWMEIEIVTKYFRVVKKERYQLEVFVKQHLSKEYDDFEQYLYHKPGKDLRLFKASIEKLVEEELRRHEDRGT